MRKQQGWKQRDITQSYDSTTVIEFLEQLLTEVAGNLLIIWDGAPIHRSKAMRAFLAEGQQNVFIWNNFLVMLPI